MDRVIATVAASGAEAQLLGRDGPPVLGIRPGAEPRAAASWSTLPEVLSVQTVAVPFPLASRQWHPEPTVVNLPGRLAIGDGGLVVMAGPCAVEDADQLLATARAVRAAGATVLRAGAWKPRTSPYAFQGIGEPALALLARVREETGLCVITEALDVEGLALVAEVADLVQIGSRSMQNYALLRAAGRIGKPVVLKRGASATVSELLLSAEYILAAGNPGVILCERGIRGFDPSTRNILDLSAIPLVRELSHLPILADPSHGTGRRELVPAMALAAVAAGADGLMVEVHPDPDRALSDGAQSLAPGAFGDLMTGVRAVAAAVGRPLATLHPAAAVP